MMRVVKVLNTSVVLAVEDGNGEVILMGKGIGFRKSIGQALTPEETDRVFVLRDRETNRNILQLAAQIDGRVFEITRRVVEYARTRYQMQLMDHIYLALTDHLAFAVKRQEEGLTLPGTYLLDVKRFNPPGIRRGPVCPAAGADGAECIPSRGRDQQHRLPLYQRPAHHRPCR